MKQLIGDKNIIIWKLAVLSALVSTLFSIFGAPFLRVFSLKAKPTIYWSTGVLVITVLFLIQQTLGGIYLGAVWTTLGTYNEFEKRGVSWKKTSLISIFLGGVFALSCIVLIKSNFKSLDLNKQFTAPLKAAIEQINIANGANNNPVTLAKALKVLPAIIISTLVITLAFGFMFESKIFELFGLLRERTISGLKWLEYRLPDAFIWFSLIGFLFALIELNSFFNSEISEKINLIALNISIISIVCFFLQGIAIFEYFTRVYSVGRITKNITYLFIFVWLSPIIGIIGIVDYWLDLRKIMRNNLGVKA